MDNRVSEIRRVIRTLRASMREAEATMHEQINRDENCSFVAQELLKMRKVMSGLVRERTTLGDNEPIVVGRPKEAWSRSRSELRFTSPRLPHSALRISART
jgi:Tfp pilus assembly protein PilX